jgi:hypothetical protein
MVVVKITEAAVADKIDTQYVEEHFSHVKDVGVVFVCRYEGGEDDEWTDEHGVRHISIQLPYREILHLTDPRPMLVELVRDRLNKK